MSRDPLSCLLGSQSNVSSPGVRVIIYLITQKTATGINSPVPNRANPVQRIRLDNLHYNNATHYTSVNKSSKQLKVQRSLSEGPVKNACKESLGLSIFDWLKGAFKNRLNFAS